MKRNRTKITIFAPQTECLSEQEIQLEDIYIKEDKAEKLRKIYNDIECTHCGWDCYEYDCGYGCDEGCSIYKELETLSDLINQVTKL